MIIKIGLECIYGIFYLLLSGVSAFELPEGVSTVLIDIYGYIDQGASFLATYTHFNYLCGLFSAVILIDSIIFTYQCIMWILKKTPFLGVSD